MTVATVTTDINIGPFKIPSNGQNMIMNNYAQRNNITVELVIPEPMMSKALATVQWIHKERKLTKVILSSIHQLPVEKDRIDELLKNTNQLKETQKKNRIESKQFSIEKNLENTLRVINEVIN